MLDMKAACASVILVLVIACASCRSPAGPHGASSASSNPNAASAATSVRSSKSSEGALASDQYNHLREQILGDSKARLSPEFKNPGISRDGLEPSTVRALQEQLGYLQAHASPVSDSSPSGGVAICRQPTIRSVNGKTTDAVFTPQAPYNSYKIEGCSFGNTAGKIQLESSAPTSGRTLLPIPLRIEDGAAGWTNQAIRAHLDTSLSGLPDYPVVLVLYSSTGHRTELAGCQFIAVRGEPRLLTTIPAAWVKLQASAVGARPIEQLEYVSPPVRSSDIPAESTGTSAFVMRLDSQIFGPGSDVYDFSHLNPGWVVDSVQLQAYTPSCPGILRSARSLGHWDTRWDAHQLTIMWQNEVCSSVVPPFRSVNLSLSQYATKVWVIGPIGTQPVSSELFH